MQTIKGAIGLPVLTDGARAGQILSVEPDEALRRIDAVYVIRRNMSVRRIDRRDIVQIGSRAVTAVSAGIPAKDRSAPLFRRAVSTDGRRLGAIVDAEFDESLSIVALWLSCGYPDDLLSGRLRITRYTVRSSDGCVLVPSGEEDFHEQRHDQGNGSRRAAWRDSRNGIRSDELGKGTPLEESGNANGPDRTGKG